MSHSRKTWGDQHVLQETPCFIKRGVRVVETILFFQTQLLVTLYFVPISGLSLTLRGVYGLFTKPEQIEPLSPVSRKHVLLPYYKYKILLNNCKP